MHSSISRAFFRKTTTATWYRATHARNGSILNLHSFTLKQGKYDHIVVATTWTSVDKDQSTIPRCLIRVFFLQTRLETGKTFLILQRTIQYGFNETCSMLHGL